uniref:Coiled-coil domain-containing protein 39 n=1 Tax=Guillardia theta (strain CCMP2712) TaxID=905079 RepID=A0A0C3T1B1_GUITC
MDPSNPLFARIRAALTKQLEDQQRKVTEDLREKDEELRRLVRQKEDVGVELYGVQQQLARMQIMLEKAHESFNNVRRVREQAEDQAKTISKDYDKKQAEIADQTKRMNKFQIELDKLNATLQQVEQYNQQMKSEIAITRRATYKAEEQVSNLEQEKKHQDLLIDDLMKSTKVLEDKLQMFSSQLAAQKEETEAAKRVLGEANDEMEKIRFEKKQLIQQWKSSLLAVQRRDEHLQGAEKVLKEVQQQEMAVVGEISSFKQSIKKEQDRNEYLSSILNKIRNSAAFLERQVEQVVAERNRLQEQFSILQKSLEQSEGELAQVESEKKVVTEEIAKMDKMIASTSNETQKIEQGILQSIAEQTTLQKAAQSIDKQTQGMQAQMHAKENEAAQVRNELARIRVDALNTMAHNDQLKSTIKEIDEELKRKEQLVAKYEVEIRRRNDDIEKKMRDLDSLNRKFENL